MKKAVCCHGTGNDKRRTVRFGNVYDAGFGMERFHAGNSLWRRGSAARFGYVDRMEKNGA